MSSEVLAEPHVAYPALRGLERFRLLIDVEDRPGTVGAVCSFLAGRGANIVELDSHAEGADPARFYMRIEFTAAPGQISEQDLHTMFERGHWTQRSLCWELVGLSRRKRVCLLASRHRHCLIDLLTRWRAGELDCEIDLVVSNHADLEGEVRRFGVRYRHIPVMPGAKEDAETQLLAEVQGRYDLLVLARYMQILSGDFLAQAATPTINIHHSFLPAFEGAGPYRRARERGVKIVGATAHYVTEELDAGPIIEQDIVRVGHRLSVEDMTRAGADVERTVLARAVRWHLEDRVAVHGNRTLVFA